MSLNPPSSSLRCTRCDDVLPPGYKPGLCPVCLMDMAMRQPTLEDTQPAGPAQKPLTPEDLQPHFPQLEILECIGRGGMGVVYKARQKALGRLVALKLLAPGQTKDAAFAERFAHEARALAALNHPNIVTVHDFGESGGFYYLLMEYVDGVNLRQAMRGSHLSPEQALAIVPPICEALQYAHEHGIVHRDIKPENLLMDKAGRVKIADFGIAKMLSQQESTTHDGTPAAGPRSTVMAGTPQYMAPEQGSVGSRADHRVDIYSLGVVLYELLTGELPSTKLPMPAQGAMTDARLDEIVRRALQQDPEQRYQTVKELQTHLATLTAVPVEAKVHSRERYERWFGLVLRVMGWLCAALGLLQLLTPFFYPVVRPSLPPRTFLDTLSSRLPEVSVSWAIAWVLIRHTRLFIRLSYRPLLIPPRQWPEVAGVVIRVAGLGTLAAGGLRVAEYADSFSSYRWDYLWQGILLIILGVCVFRFEHALVPVVHAVPVWKPLPYAEHSARRRLSVHALCGGLLLAGLIGLVHLMIIDLSEDLSRTAEWEADELAWLLARVLAGSLLAGLTTLTGWAAVALIRRSAGRLRGLVLASAAAAALPLYLVFVLLCSLLYRVGENRPAGQEYLVDGSVLRTLPNRPATLLWVTMVAAGVSILLWLVFWRRLRTQPAPLSPATAPCGSGRRMTLFLSVVGVLIFCVGMPSFFRRSSTPLTIPDEQFARHVERHIQMHLGLAGHQFGMTQGSLKLPPPGEWAVFPLPDLRDMHGRPLKGSLNLLRTSTGIQITGGAALSYLRLSLEQTPFKAVRREVLLPAMPEGSDKVFVIANNASAVIGAKTPARRGHFQRDNRIDLVVRPTADGGLKILGAGMALVASDFPSGRNWLELDNEKVVEAYKQAFSASRFDDQEATLAGGRSPSVFLFVNNRRVGLLEHLGPSKPGAKDVKLRVQMLPGWGN